MLRTSQTNATCSTKPGLLVKKNSTRKRHFLDFDKIIECVSGVDKKGFPENALSIRSAVKDCLAPKGNLFLEIQFAVFYPLTLDCQLPAVRNTICANNY